MRLVTYIFCFFAFVTLSNGLLFKIMHWPGASFMIVAAYPLILIAALLLLIYQLTKDKK